MEENKLLTVAIPTYNGGENLINAVKSCKHIDLPLNEYEILIVDNCSSDGSIEKIQELIPNLPNIRIHRNNKNIGRVNNWNKCLDLAKSKYLLFLFSSDLIHKDFSFKKAIQIALSKSYPTVMFNTLYLDEHKSYVFYHYDSGEWILKDFIDRYFIQNMTSLGILQSHLFDLSIIKQKGIRFDNDIDRTTDRVFIFNVINSKGYFYFINEIGTIWFLSKNRYHYSIHSNLENIKPEDLYIYLYKLWIQEMIADFYILKNTGYTEEKIHQIFYEYILRIYYSNTIRFPFKRKHSSVEREILDLFVKYLEKYSQLKGFSTRYLKATTFLKSLFKKIIAYFQKKIIRTKK